MKNGKPVILCVDDDKDILETLKVVLEANGYSVRTAGTGEAAFTVWQAEKPDLVIVDLMMEEVDAGTSLVMRLKAQGNTAPVFLLSSVGEQLGRSIDYHQLGLAGVFQKPIEPATLLKTLKQHLK
mgnify:CR=1 FL=1